MKKYLVALILAVAGCLSSPAYGANNHPLQQADCAAEAPYGFPKDSVARGSVVCHTAYVLKHDNVAKIPAWVSYTLSPEQTEGCFKRSDAFAADPKLRFGGRAEKSDYRRSGYDKGHIANSADMTWDQEVDRESFYLSNMTPQTHAFNAGIWKELEMNVRSWAFTRKHTLLIYAGPIYNASDKTIGDNKVVVPHAFYKIVVDTVTKDSLAFLFPHSAPPGSDLSPYLTSVEKVEKASGISFSLPFPNDKKSVGTLWTGNLNALAKSKKETCALRTK